MCCQVFKNNVGGDEVLLHPVETGPALVTQISVTVRGDPKRRWILELSLIIMYQVYTQRIWDCNSQSRVCKLKQTTVDN